MTMVLRMTSSGYKVRGCPSSIPGWVLKKEIKEKSTHLINVLYILYVIYIYIYTPKIITIRYIKRYKTLATLKFSTAAYRVVVSTDHIRLNAWPSNYLFTLSID